MYEGTYVCEVSAEAPFPTDFAVANMSVAILPSRDPIIEGVLPSYGIGDFLEANCTSPPSFPVSELTFFLNGRKVRNVHKIVWKCLIEPKWTWVF